MKGIVTEIQRFSLHDGPGIRTTVFFKGCNLRCFWCHNPETQNPAPEVQFYPSRCIGCGACFRICPRGAHVLRDGAHIIERERCVACGRCAEECYSQALVRVGREVSVTDVMREILEDRAFYENSDGGVTLSGGEPLLQPAFCEALLTACRAEGISTAIETAANVPWSLLERFLPLVDLVMMDLKTMDEAVHRAATGADNARILSNARRLGASGKPLIVRTPVIPGVNDTPEAIEAIARFVAPWPNVIAYELLPFHPMAGDKYTSLGRSYAAQGLSRPAPGWMKVLAETARSAGVRSVRCAQGL